MPIPLPTPAPSLRRRLVEAAVAQPLPTLLPRWGPAGANLAPSPRCEDCYTTTLTKTYYVDESGQSTTCTSTEYQTTYQTNTIAPQPTPTSTSQYETVYHTKTSTILSSPTAIPNPPAQGESGWPPYSQQPLGSSCQCEHDWVKTFLGGIPHGAKEVMA